MEYSPKTSPSTREAPIQSAFRYLTATEGDILQLMTRANPILAQAAQVGYIFSNVLKYPGPENTLETKNDYVAGYCGQLMRFSVSRDAGGREDIIRALGEGGKVPDSYYEGKVRQTFEEIP